MKKFILISILSMFITLPCSAKTNYHIEVVQTGNTGVYDCAYEGVMDGLARAGLVKGYNLDVGRTVIDSGPGTNPLGRFIHYLNLNKTASCIADKKPDLVITIGSHSTTCLKDRFIEKGIPVVFTNISSPEVPGMRSEGSTGVSIDTDTNMIMDAALLAFPEIKTVGIIHSSTDYNSEYISKTGQQLSKLGLRVIIKQVDMNEKITSSARQLMAQGVDAFFIPVDPYYKNPNNGAGKDLIELSFAKKIPCISSGFGNIKGSLIYISPNFDEMGDLTAGHIIKILKEGMDPDELPITRLADVNIVVNANITNKLGSHLFPDTNNLISIR